MKTAYLKSNTIEVMFKQLKRSLGGSLKQDSNEYVLEIENEIGKGKIQGISLKGGISYLEFNMVFSDDLILSIHTTEKNPIYFTYCSKGSLSHSFGIDGEKRVLESFQTGILTSQEEDVNVLYFKKDEVLKNTLITVQTDNRTHLSGNGELKTKLRQTFFKEGTPGNFVYIGSHNLKIAEKIQQLNSITQDGIVRSLLTQGLVHMILALEIQQHTDDMKNQESCMGSLSIRDMDAIKEASVFIENNYDAQLSITELCSQFSISPSKLQEGFKLMHGRTVTDYVRDVRVCKAEELIKNTDLNISEVVYSIGFTSRSYFSKIFKAKYNCSPKEYKDSQRLMAISA
ncbi:helix-turn-helix domain-containing protein [Mariniflexile ostreae]|uniref:Helix-turn-helix domain-containing protein n=1 Tax=Mariniflexile ostreae TaxID=1520892 RepID=A0ABV5F9M1_9FLAO